MQNLYFYRATVLEVHDGDTVTLKVDLGFRTFVIDRFRLYGPDPAAKMGLNAPELTTPAGKRARSALVSILGGLPEMYVHTVKDKREKFGRILAVLLGVEGQTIVNVNQKMVDGGFAVLKSY